MNGLSDLQVTSYINKSITEALILRFIQDYTPLFDFLVQSDDVSERHKEYAKKLKELNDNFLNTEP